MPDSAAEVVQKRRAEREKGRRACIACGSASATTASARPDAPYRILRGGMHVGDLQLTPADGICRFCEASGQVRKYGVGGV